MAFSHLLAPIERMHPSMAFSHLLAPIERMQEDRAACLQQALIVAMRTRTASAMECVALLLDAGVTPEGVSFNALCEPTLGRYKAAVRASHLTAFGDTSHALLTTTPFGDTSQVPLYKLDQTLRLRLSGPDRTTSISDYHELADSLISDSADASNVSAGDRRIKRAKSKIEKFANRLAERSSVETLGVVSTLQGWLLNATFRRKWLVRTLPPPIHDLLSPSYTRLLPLPHP